MDRNSISSHVEMNQIQRSANPERQDRSETPSERESRHMRFLRSVPSDSPSTSNTDHPMPASELGQTSNQDHPQPERRQERLRNALRCMWNPVTHLYRGLISAIDDMNNTTYYWEMWAGDDDNDVSIPNKEKIQELLNIKLDGVKNGAWDEFSKHLVNKYDPIVYDSDSPRESSDPRLLSDVLQGGPLIIDKDTIKDNHVNSDDRNNEAYKKIKGLAREEWKMYNAGALLGTDLSEVRPERWSQFSHDLLEKHKNYRYLTDILRGYTADYLPDDGHLQADPVSDEERKSSAYKNLIRLASDEWEEWKRKKAGALLGRDLSEVRPERWSQFSHDLLLPYKDKDEDEDEHMLLKDILQGGVTCVKDEARESEAYGNLIFMVRQSLEKQIELRNNRQE